MPRKYKYSSKDTIDKLMKQEKRKLFLLEKVAAINEFIRLHRKPIRVAASLLGLLIILLAIIFLALFPFVVAAVLFGGGATILGALAYLTYKTLYLKNKETGSIGQRVLATFLIYLFSTVGVGVLGYGVSVIVSASLTTTASVGVFSVVTTIPLFGVVVTVAAFMIVAAAIAIEVNGIYKRSKLLKTGFFNAIVDLSKNENQPSPSPSPSSSSQSFDHNDNDLDDDFLLEVDPLSEDGDEGKESKQNSTPRHN